MTTILYSVELGKSLFYLLKADFSRNYLCPGQTIFPRIILLKISIKKNYKKRRIFLISVTQVRKNVRQRKLYQVIFILYS